MFAGKIRPMPKQVKIFFETTETKETKKKGYVIVDTDYTQVYDCFSDICVKLRSISSVKLLFWLLSNEVNKSNGISSGKHVFEKFNKHLEENGIEKIGERTFQACFEELTSIGVFTKVGRGHYYINPYLFWRDSIKKRTDFIIDEGKEKRYKSLNPREDKLLAENNKK